MKTSRIDWNTLKQHGFNQSDFNRDLHQSVVKLIANLKQLDALQTRFKQSRTERLTIRVPDATTKLKPLSPTSIWEWDDSNIVSLIKSPRSLLEKHSESDPLRQRITRLPRFFSPQKKTSHQGAAHKRCFMLP